MGNNVLSIEDKINSLISVVTSLAKPKGNSSSGAATTDNSQNAVDQQSQYGTDSILQLVDTGDFDSNKSSSDSSDESMSYRSTTSFPSPEKKKVRSSPPSSTDFHLICSQTHPQHSKLTQFESQQQEGVAFPSSELDEISTVLEAQYESKAPDGGLNK